MGDGVADELQGAALEGTGDALEGERSRQLAIGSSSEQQRPEEKKRWGERAREDLHT